MTAYSPRVLFALAGTVCAFAAGCGGKAFTSEDTTQMQAALDTDNGGMTTTAESPAFGDVQVQAIASFDTAFADGQDVTATAPVATGARLYHVALLWGHLPPPHDADDTAVAPSVIDWTGSVSIDAGAIGVKKTLAFDKLDHVDPRTSANVVSFTSHTLPAVDGLFLHVMVPPNGSSILHFDTVALKTEIDLSQLGAKAGGAVRLQDGRNGLAYVGYPDVPGCARGLMFGHWSKVVPGLGHLRARVIDGNGDLLGHAKGLWGHAPKRDKNVFFGKYIGVNGEHRGLFGGIYGDGAYFGIWGTIDPRNAGTLEGVYSDGLDHDDDKGVLVGRWSERCATP